jgi:hypothetical protein
MNPDINQLRKDLGLIPVKNKKKSAKVSKKNSEEISLNEIRDKVIKKNKKKGKKK